MGEKCQECNQVKSDVVEGTIYGWAKFTNVAYCLECFAKKDLEECAKCDIYVPVKEAFRDDDDEDRAVCPQCADNYHITEKYQ